MVVISTSFSLGRTTTNFKAVDIPDAARKFEDSNKISLLGTLVDFPDIFLFCLI